MLKKFVWVAASVAMLSLGAVTAKAGKIGYIDVKSAVENTKDYQNGLHHLETLKAQKLKELRGLKAKIDQAEKDILSQSMAMSQERLAQKQSSLKELRKSAARRQQDAQEELVAAKNQLDQKVVGHFYKVARQYGKDNGFDLVLPKSNMIYVNDALDITPAITKLLDGKK